MNSLSRTLSAAFAVAWSAALWATPTSSWVNFSGGTTADGITTYTGTNSAYTIKVTGGTKAADGSYIQLGTPAQAATETEAEVPATTGSLELTFPATFGSGKKFTIIAEVEGATFSGTGDYMLRLPVGTSGAVVSIRPESTPRLWAYWKSGSSANERARGTGACSVTGTWTPANRQIIAITYKAETNVGTRAYWFEKENDVWTSKGSLTDSGLFMSTGGEIQALHFGTNAMGMKIYSFHVYETNLANADAIIKEVPAIEVLEREAEAQKKLAEVSSSANWTTLSWKNALTDTAVDAPTAADTVGLKAVSGANTLALDNTTAVTVADLVTTGAGSLAISGDGSLSATATCINTNTDITAATNLSLGAVTIGAGNELTIAPSTRYSSLLSETTSSGADDASKVVVDATRSALSVESTDSRSAALKSFTGVVEFKGLGDTGATVAFGYANSGQAFKPRFIFNGGTHTMKYGCGDNLFSPGGTDEKPTISVTGGAALAFRLKDLSGWSNSPGATASVIRVGEESSLELLGDNETTPASSSTGYFRDRILLDSGASVTNSHSKFYFYGGVGGVAQLAMLDNQGTATWNGGFETKGEMKIDIGSASTLELNGVVSGTHAVTKAGAGTLTLTGANTKRGTLTISAGTVKLQDSGSWAGSITNNGILEVVNATDKIIANTISGTGTVKKSGAGTLSLTGAVSTPVELAEGTLNLGTLRPTIVGLVDGATLKLTATEEELADCAITLSTTLASSVAKERLTVVKADGTNLTVTDNPTLAEDGTLTITLPSSGKTITTDGNWSDVGASSGTVYVKGSEKVDDPIEITLDTALTDVETIEIVGGSVKFITTNAQQTLPALKIKLRTGAMLTTAAAFDGSYTVPTKATLIFDGTTVAVTSGESLTVEGTLKTKGAVTLTSTSNQIATGGVIEVLSGTTSLMTQSGGNGIKGNVTIAKEATLSCGTSDAPLYTAAQTFDISGTLEIVNDVRWTISGAAVFNLHDGACLKGEGPKSGTDRFAFDFWKSNTLNIDGNVSLEGRFGAHDGGATLTIKPTKGTTTFSGVVTSGLNVALNIGDSATVALEPSSEAPLTVEGALSGSGALTIGDGTNAAKVTLNAANGAYLGTITIANNAELVTAGSASVPLGKGSVVNNGKLTFGTSNGQMMSCKGTGDVAVTASCKLPGTLETKGKLEIAAHCTLTMDSNADSYGTVDFPDATPEINGPDVSLAAGSAIAVGTNLDNGTVTIPAGRSLSGSGLIGVPLTLANGATLDASAGALTVTEDVTIAEDATVTVTPSATAATGSPILTCKNPAAIIEKLSATGRLLALDDETNPTAILLVVPAISLPAGSTGTLTDSAAEVVKALAAQNGLASASLSGTTKGGSAELDPAAMSAALELFSGITAVDADAQSIKVDYDFGIAKLEPTSLAVTVTVQIMHGDAAAALAEGAELSLVSATSGDKIADMGAGFQPVTGTPGAYVGYFSLDSLKAGAFKVKAATKVTSTEGEATN